ncbi:MAG TPA: RodZ domain-containing protein [Methylophilaceae bacterium]
MSDIHEQDVVDMTPTVSVGAALKSAREARQLDIEDVCNYLRLSRRQVVALESDDFSALPEATITRGFIRNYARMLELDAAPLLDAYRSMTADAAPQPISIPSENIDISDSDARPWRLYVSASILIVLLVAAWIIYVDYVPKAATETVYMPTETELELVDGSAAEQMQAAAGEQENTAETSSGETVAEPDRNPAEEVRPDVAETAAVVAAQPAAATDGLAELRLKASERSWVSITDRNNRNLFDKIMAVGVEEVVRGEPPLQVVVGNAPHTTLTYNNQVIDLAPATNGRVARLKLE